MGVLVRVKACLACPICARSRTDRCPNMLVMGFRCNGGWAEYVAVPIQLGTGALFGVNAQSLLGHLGYSKANLDTVVDLVASRRLVVSASVSGVLALTDVTAGVEQLRSKQGNPIRLVVAP